ncbi:MAG: hypothetical protein ACLFS3_01235 [Candidatus Aenigmatarchaeota archaeon]
MDLNIDEYFLEAGVACLISFTVSLVINSFGIYLALLLNLLVGALAIAYLVGFIYDIRIYIVGSWLLGIFIARYMGFIDVFGALVRALFFFTAFFVLLLVSQK